MPEKSSNRTYGLLALLFGISGIASIAILRVFPAGSLYELLFSILGVSLIVVAVGFLFFFFTLQWRWTHGQPQPRPLG
jgi:hypothetical protein